MKKAILMIALVLLATTGMAQLIGLPIAATASSQPLGTVAASGGIVLGDDLNLYGGRISFSPVNILAIFGDLGLIDPDVGKTGFAAQGGGLLTLPIRDLPVDVGLRATAAYAAFDIPGGDLTMNTLNAGVLVSRDLNPVSPYVFLGLNFADVTAKSHGYKASEDETDLALAAGLIVKLTTDFSLYGEVAHVDDLFVAVGARWTH